MNSIPADPIKSYSRAIPNLRQVVKDIAFTAKSPTIHIRSCLSRSLLILIAVPFQQQRFHRPRNSLSASGLSYFVVPFRQWTVCIQMNCIQIRYELPFATPCAIYARKYIYVKHFAGYRKCLLRLRFPPSLLPLLPSLTVTLCFHKGEHFPDDAALPQLCGLDRADTSRFIHQIHFPYCADILPRSIHPLRRISPL